MALPTVGRFRSIYFSRHRRESGRPRPSTVNPYSYDTAVLTIFPEYIEFDGEDVLQLAVKKEPRKSTE